jgi:hypothetical protein
LKTSLASSKLVETALPIEDYQIHLIHLYEFPREPLSYGLWFVYFIIAVTTASSIMVLELLKSKKNTTVTFTEFLEIGALVARV